jgi:predicted nucleotide-binding protein
MKRKPATKSKTCFIMSPIGDPDSEVRRLADNLSELIVGPVCTTLGYTLVRLDRIPLAGSLTQEIIRLVMDADLVIADITNMNPNVMYELGIRHALGRPCIQISRQGERIPFDIASYRTILYDLSSAHDVKRARDTLRATMEHVKEAGTSVSPVTDAARRGSFPKRGTSAEDGADIPPLLRSVVERLGVIEGSIATIGRGIEEARPKRDFTRDVFIVHGHDGELKNELAQLLQKIDFNPIILHEQPDRGQTILQKLQYEGSRVGYAFILHTPDDEGRKRGADSLAPRSRQNVVFEHGMFVGQFSHRRVCAIVREGVEIPSDLSGVIYKIVPHDAGINAIALEIVNELRAAGYIVDANKLLA